MDRLVSKYHSQQLRNDRGTYLPAKIPYPDHLYGVKSILLSALHKTKECQNQYLLEDMCNAALGHDLLKDTDITEAEISESTNEHVLALIKEITNPVDDAHTEQYMEQLKNASEEARLIKYADLIENTTSVAYNYYDLGEQWVHKFYTPMLSTTCEVLAKTQFTTYHRTADFMRDTLSIYKNLLKEKREVSETIFQYPIKAVEVVTEAISDKVLKANIDESYRIFREICEHYHKGYATYRDVIRIFNDTFFSKFDNFIRGRGLRWQINWDSWERFVDDYRLWEAGEKPCSDKGSSWLLLYRKESIPGGKQVGEDASYIDRTQFFKLMKAFHFPLEYFQPAPAGTIYPDIRASHPNDYLVGFDIWENDGGLLADDFQLGSTVSLTDHYGLSSVIEITEHLNEEEKNKRRTETDFIGLGYMEGYMTSRKREIRISLYKGKIWSLLTYQQDRTNADYEAYKSFPLWKNAHEHNDKWNKLRYEVIDDLIKYFWQETEG